MGVRAVCLGLSIAVALASGAAPAFAKVHAPSKAAAKHAAKKAADKPLSKEEEIVKTVPAKKLFGEKELPSIGKAAAIGYYPKGCLQGGVELPPTGATWQVMRISRNRNWGHPALVKFLERFAPLAAKATGWHGVLVGDMAQPRGGPLPFGHSSHQIGLDVDVWFMPMPDRVLSKEERDSLPFLNLVADDWKHINKDVWTPAHAAFIRTAAEQPEVERVLVNAAIKKELCTMQGNKHPSWMDKVRPWYGHHDHIHVRLKCPPGSPACRAQEPPHGGSECSDKDLKFWFSDKVLHPPEPTPPAKTETAKTEDKPESVTAEQKAETVTVENKADKEKKTATAKNDKKKKNKKPHVLTLADLPPACKDVLAAPAPQVLQSKAN